MKKGSVIPYNSDYLRGAVAVDYKEPEELQPVVRRRRRPKDAMVISERKFRAACKMFMTFYVASILTVLVLAGVLGYNLGKKQVDFLPYTSTEVYTVKGGDTLWSIAEDLSDGTHDIRRIVYEIQDINDLKGDRIYPWQELIVPVIE